MTSPTLADHVEAFLSLLRAGHTVEAMERYYDDEVVVFENRELARAGRRACIDYERSELARHATAPQFRLSGYAVNPKTDHVFLEYTIRFTDKEGRTMRLEEVAVQKWHRAKIVQERFYYEGFVDESDPPETSPEPEP